MIKVIAASLAGIALISSLSACGSAPSAAAQVNCNTTLVQLTDLNLDMSKFSLDVQLASISGSWSAVVTGAKALSAKLTTDAAPLAGTAKGDAVVAAVKAFSAANYSTQASLTAALAPLSAPVTALKATCVGQ